MAGLDWVRRTNAYLSSATWPAVRFQPVLYLFLWVATIRLALYGGKPPRFDSFTTSTLIYPLWLGMGIASPMIALSAWWMMGKRTGRTRFVGMWFRLAGDIGVLTVLGSFHIADMMYVGASRSETHLYSRYITTAALAFVLLLVIRDVWTVVLTERMAGRIHREAQRDG